MTARLLFTIPIILIFSFNLFAQNTVSSAPSTFAGDGTGSSTWSSTSNATSSNDAYATTTFFIDSEVLKATNFGFSIPSTATINGIVVDVERSITSDDVIRDKEVKIIKGGVVSATSRATNTSWPGVDAIKTYGSSSDLWGETWTPADINASNFGIGISARIFISGAVGGSQTRIDNIQITVHYSNPLPIELLYFNATPEKERKIKTNWSTVTEINNAYFDVERSQDAIHFEKVDSVLGAGNSNTTLNYTYYDTNPYTGISYYRLKQVDNDGQYSYSPIRTVYLGNLDIISIYPNPSVGSFKYILASEHGGPVTIKVLDVLGKEVYHQEEILEEDSKLTTYEISTKEFAKGAYFLQITTPQKEKTQKQFLVD